MTPDSPYRGPEKLEGGDWKYTSTLSGDIKDFIGNEKIYYKVTNFRTKLYRWDYNQMNKGQYNEKQK